MLDVELSRERKFGFALGGLSHCSILDVGVSRLHGERFVAERFVAIDTPCESHV